ncbi:hypothetical protein [Neobacillus sp. 114]|uniref:hypothetical protein n=1 Tax=Neobacillus sp. 114 TaxID=3048535 RepID=UPI0024C2EC67|nr:hypothetical protein [Neobacillus sp. 114]
MDDDWYDGYDGGVYTGSGTKGSKRKTRTRIPSLKSFIPKGSRRKRSRRGKVSDPETTIGIWVVMTALGAALFHAEWISGILYTLFVIYTLVSKDLWPIKYVSVILTGMGILFFVALGLAVLLNLAIGSNILTAPATQVAYGYIIKAPLLSWSIVWVIENGMDWIKKRKMTKGNFVEKQKLLLYRLPALCLAASTVLLAWYVVHSLYTLYQWGIWGLNLVSIIHSWTAPFIIGITILGRLSKRWAK